MAESISVPTANLLLDSGNPRLSASSNGQRETLRALAEEQGPKLRVLAEDIVEHGLDPSELTIVMPSAEPGRFIVLDGNRRLGAIRALEAPEILDGAVPQAVLNAFRKSSEVYQENPIYEISCVLFENRESADHWLELRHTGERGGAGAVLWSGQARSRFLARATEVEPYMQALDFLHSRGALPAERRVQVPGSTLGRLLSTPHVRDRLGIELVDGKLRALAPEDEVEAVLLHIVDDITDGPIKVNDVYYVEQRKAYIDALPAAVVPRQTHEPGKGVALGTDPPEPSKRQRRRPRVPKPRERLIPGDCVLDVSDARLHAIETELRHLNIETYTNAVSVLLRVFLELTADWYIEDRQLATQATRLGGKLNAATDDLVKRQKLTSDEAKAARRAAQRGTFLAPSVTQLHQWIHNKDMFPGPADLRSEWDGLQPWFMAVWAPQ